MVNDAWSIGDDFVLRIVREESDKECDDEPQREAAVTELALKAGIRTPRLIASNTDCDLAPRPYTIYQKARGVPLGFIERDPAEFDDAYREVGRELYKLHQIAVPNELIPLLRKAERPDPNANVEKALAARKLSVDDASEMSAFIRELEGSLVEDANPVLIHHDVHPWNLIVDGDALSAIVDWGDASFGDPARDFAGMPMVAVPAMLQGYAEAGGTIDLHFKQRSVHVRMEAMLWELRELEAATYERAWWALPVGDWRGILANLHLVL